MREPRHVHCVCVLVCLFVFHTCLDTDVSYIRLFWERVYLYQSIFIPAPPNRHIFFERGENPSGHAHNFGIICWLGPEILPGSCCSMSLRFKVSAPGGVFMSVLPHKLASRSNVLSRRQGASALGVLLITISTWCPGSFFWKHRGGLNAQWKDAFPDYSCGQLTHPARWSGGKKGGIRTIDLAPQTPSPLQHTNEQSAEKQDMDTHKS